jgi:hypothetical protein
MKALPGTVDRATLVNLAKYPNCLGDLRAIVLELLERQGNTKFEGDLWKMVHWAERQHPPLDVRSPPKKTSQW